MDQNKDVRVAVSHNLLGLSEQAAFPNIKDVVLLLLGGGGLSFLSGL